MKTHLEEQVLNSPVNVVHFELRIADEVPVQGQHGVDAFPWPLIVKVRISYCNNEQESNMKGGSQTTVQTKIILL